MGKELPIYCVYSHNYVDSKIPFYIGSGNLLRPFEFDGRNREWNKIVKGLNYEFTVNILLSYIDMKDSLAIEEMLIQEIGRVDLGRGPLCNKKTGFKEYITSENVRLKMSLSKRGEKNPFYGKTHTPENIILIKKGNEMRVGENNSFYGKKHNSESLKKMSESAKERVLNGVQNPLPIMIGINNYSTKIVLAINHNTSHIYCLKGSVEIFLNEFKLAYSYYQKFRDKGKCFVEDFSKVRGNCLNTVNWEFRDLGRAKGSDFVKIQKDILEEFNSFEFIEYNH